MKEEDRRRPGRRATHLLHPENIRTVTRSSEEKNSQERQNIHESIREEQSRTSEQSSEKNSQEHQKAPESSQDHQRRTVESCRNGERKNLFENSKNHLTKIKK